MRLNLPRLLAIASLVVTCAASASPLSIVTTIKPLALIVNDIAGEEANVDVLLPTNASPHDYALKPSDIKKIKTADMVVWVGPELELFLEKILLTQKNALQLTNYDGMPVMYYGEQEGHDDHDHHGHDHAGIDGHIWLGPEQSKVIAEAVREYLARKDPQNAAEYKNNYDKFVAEISQTQQVLTDNFAAIENKGYFLFHDAYGYFESAFGLSPRGHFTVDPERKPGARTLVTIRTTLQNKEAQCVFTEPQFNPSLIKSVTKGTGVKLVELDPMAQDLDLNTQGYKDFLLSLGSSYLECFQP
ncbi:zinc ABC transporter substrate-binding protein ZnuA [Enterovibrio norvegicus]|uniref:zinc ABC transporter substrate-binding protein ZnuA n=1 Tax=Enterovibrio norvegicus TaxID=188144 RepID=UPI00354C0DC7